MKVYRLLRTFTFLCVCLFPFKCYGQKVTIDGINYVINYSNSAMDGLHGTVTLTANEECPYSGDFVIPDHINYTFDVTGGRGTETVSNPSVDRIGNMAFADCTQLTSIHIPQTVWRIESDAFIGCTNIEKITVDKGQCLESPEGSNCVISYISDLLILGCKNTIIPSSVKTIGENAFHSCVGLKSITIPDNVREIMKNSFAGCVNLKDVYLLSTSSYEIVDADKHAFDSSIKEATLHTYDYLIESYKEKDGWKEFGNFAVIEKITDFDLVYYVDGEKYKTIQYKYDDDIIPLEDPVRDGYTFSGWSEIPTNMPGKEVKVYGTFTSNEVNEGGVIYQAFSERAAVIGNDNAAGEVKIAASVTFNEKSVPVTDIVDFSFKGNTGITSVVIPESVMKIGDEAFYGCKNLTKIELGKSVNKIEPRAFAGIDKLTDVTIYAEDVPETDRTAFENSYIEDYVTLHVPAKALEKYKEAAPWKNFKEIVAIAEPEPVKYTLTYKVDGEIYETFELLEGDEIEALEEPTKEGYTFSGWDDVPETMPGEDVTVSGTFTINKYLLIYMVDDEIYQKYEIEYGKEITAEKEPVKEGYVFSGWSEIPETMPAKDIVVKGTFKEDTAKGGEEGDDPEDVETGEEVIKISDAGQTTWCSKYDLDFTDFEDVKVYIASGYDRETGIILLTRVKKVPAGEGVYIIADKGDYNIPYKKINAYYANLMKGTIEAITLKETDGEYTNYYLSNGKQGVGFYKVNGTVDLKANRAYLPLLKNEVSSSRGFIGLDFDDGEDGTTGIRNTMQTTEKDVWYNLQGQRVNNPGRGLYIRNGKKVFVR